MKRRATALPSSPTSSQAFLAHIYELRRRLYIIVASVIVGAGLSYAFEHAVLEALLRPAHGQQFIYTSPMGGMNFLFNVCLYLGLIVSIPVITYQLLKFIEPTLPKQSGNFVFKIALASAILALVGLAFGYFIGLPNALHFLLNQFITQQVKPLVTIQSYMSFVGMYMFGSALLLQAPLLLLFINHIKPLKPGKLLRQERWVILIAFIGAFVMNPTPNVFAQSLVAVPIIISYHIGVVIIWLVNRRPNKPDNVISLVEKDLAMQAERMTRALHLKPLPAELVAGHPPVPVSSNRRPAHYRQYTASAPRPIRRQLVM